MVALFAFHFIVGILLGLRYRFGVVFAIAAAAGVEGLAAQYWFQAGPWYIVALGALMAGQAGYVASAFVISQLKPAAQNRADLPSGAVR